jgi:hypothetical protein
VRPCEGDTEGSRLRSGVDRGLTPYRLRFKYRGLPQGSQDAGSILMDIPSYISGYVDGEGCFTVSFSPRLKLRVGWEVRPSFSVSQNADRSEVLMLMRRHFGCGTIRPDRSDRTVKYEVRSIDDLVTRIIPQFEAFPLVSGKAKDFQRFAKVCRLVRTGAHLTVPGFRQVADLALGMNVSGKRRFTLERLVGPSGSEVIVSATSNGGLT